MKVYLDYNATTPLADEARIAMEPYLNGKFGNPSSLHWAGQEARKGLDEARAEVAKIFHVGEGEIYFTSGGTEAANLALNGILMTRKYRLLSGKPHVIASPIEHHSVLEPIQVLEKRGELSVSWLTVDAAGQIDPDEVRKLIHPETALIAMMFANNEIGNIYPITAVGRIAREHKIPFFCDGVQAVGKLPIDLTLLPIDLFSFSAHKFYGPKGVGGLFARKGTRLESLLVGGSQERGKRGGTENLAGIVGLAGALKKVYGELEIEMRREAGLRDRLQEMLLCIPGAKVYGDPQSRVGNTLSIGFEGIASEMILVAMDREGIAASNGAACVSGALEPSHVLLAMGCSQLEAKGAVRFSIGRETTEEEIEYVGKILPNVVNRLRNHVGFTPRDSATLGGSGETSA
ncbi:MAG: cysteine desulfurase [Deltaproteobacteria bacterium]|nr:cysteine desulfurase [Deltaproteobacteria bacterium]